LGGNLTAKKKKMKKKIISLVVFMICMSFYINVQAEKKLNVDLPLLTTRQYFQYKGLSASNVNLRTLTSLDCDMLKQLYYQSPQCAVDHVSLIILVQHALEGVDIQNFPMQTRIDLALSEILEMLRKAGRNRERNAYQGITYTCLPVIPSVAALCQILDQRKMAILREHYHYRLIF
jgi:hypothetical protein